MERRTCWAASWKYQDTNTTSGTPFLGQIPLLKYLFSSSNTEHVTNELVFLLVPHIVRAQELSDLNRRTFDVGTGSSIELRMAPKQATPADATPAAATPNHNAATDNWRACNPSPPNCSGANAAAGSSTTASAAASLRRQLRLGGPANVKAGSGRACYWNRAP